MELKGFLSRNRQVLNLTRLEDIRAVMRARHVEPDMDCLSAIAATAQVMGIHLTAVEEGKAEVGAKRHAAQRALNAVPAVEETVQFRVKQLEQQIQEVGAEGVARVNTLKIDAASSMERANDILGLIRLLNPSVEDTAAE